MVIYCYSDQIEKLTVLTKTWVSSKSQSTFVLYIYFLFQRHRHAVSNLFTLIKLLITKTNGVFTTVNTSLTCKEMNKIKIQLT